MQKSHKILVSLIWMTALAACGGGAASTNNTTATNTSGLTSPSAPVSLTASAGDAMATLSFSSPANDGGAKVSSYRGDCVGAGVTHSGTNSLSPIFVMGLSNDINYLCTVVAINSVGAGTSSNSVGVTPKKAIVLSTFSGNIILGVPTSNSIKANVFSPLLSGAVSISYGTNSGLYIKKTNSFSLVAEKPLEINIEGLSSNTKYYYRLNFDHADGSNSGQSEEYSFHTARPIDSSFTFSVQGDSHPERASEFNADLYRRTLLTAAADKPDFHITLGDDFSVDTLNANTITAAQVSARYALQRPYLGLIGNSAPVFLVNGNHEQSAGYLLDGTSENVAVWAQNARNTYYSQPASDGFYSGNSQPIPHIGLARNYYAWTWGDALFVTIDPYLPSTVPLATIFGSATPNNDIWAPTHGDAQYQWLKATLEQSKAKYKFIFAHHVMGAGRGGVEVASLGEWGGLNRNGISEFSNKRNTWASPIHQLMVANKVNIFFQGHDHVWVRQQLDGVTYQTLSEPANPNYNESEWARYFLSGDKFPNSGYTRVNVTPNGVKVDYVRTYLPADEVGQRLNGSVAFSYTLK
nr:metallophosphoesterase [uncultured Undibacterium sp.]